MPAPARALPRISVVVPSYNQGHFLRQCLESIFCQGYPDLEVIVMDGGSTDESLSIIQAQAAQLKYWQSKPDGGQSAAINAGMKHCTGDLVAWLNSDDFFWGESLWVVGRAYLAHPGRGLYVGNGFRYDERSGLRSPFCARHVVLNREALTLGPDYLLQPATFMLRKAWEAIGGLAPELRFIMDWDVFLRIAERYPAVLIHEFLAVSREYEATKTRSGKMERAYEIVRLVQRHTGQELTPGSTLFLLETLADVARDLSVEELSTHLMGGVRAVARHISLRWGGGHGFPERSDPQDQDYLPGATAGSPEPPLPTRGGWPSISLLVIHRHRLEVTLASVSNQGYPGRLEVVLCSDGPTAQLADSAEAPAFQLVGAPKRGEKLAAALNRGLTQASGDLVACLCAGDRLTIGALRAVARAASEGDGADLVYANALHVAGDRLHLAQLGACLDAFWYGDLSDVDRAPLGDNRLFPVAMATVFFRRELTGLHGAFDEFLPHELVEWEFLARLASKARARKLERTQALCAARRVDVLGWSGGWFRLRCRGPALFSRQFLPALLAYLRGYAGRTFQTWRAVNTWRGVVQMVLAALSRRDALDGLWSPTLVDDSRPTAGPAGFLNACAEPEPEPRPTAKAQMLPRMAPPRSKPHFRSLVSGPYVPVLPARSGGELREHQVLHALARHSSIAFFSYASRPAPAGLQRQPPIETVYTPGNLFLLDPHLVWFPDLRRRWWSRLGLQLRRWNMPVPGPECPHDVTEQFALLRAFTSFALPLALQQQPDFLWVTPQTNPLLLTLAPATYKARTILLAHAVGSQVSAARSETARGLTQLALRWEAARSRAFERRSLALVDGVVAACETDREFFIEAYGLAPERVLVMGKSAPDQQSAPPRAPSPATISFVGNLAIEPNRRAAERLVGRIFPRIHATNKSARLQVVDLGPSSALRGGGPVQVVSSATDLAPYLARAAVACLPLPAHSSVEGLALEVCAAGVPLACTADAVEGLGLEAGLHYLVGQDDAELADAVCRLLRDPGLAGSMAERARDAVERQHGPETKRGDLGGWLANLATLPRRHEGALVAA